MVTKDEEEQILKPIMDFDEAVDIILADLGKMLKEKNESYGNAALKPIRVFSKADALEQIKVRLDDKLSRLMRGKEYGQEDTYKDILGYLILHQIHKNYAVK